MSYIPWTSPPEMVNSIPTLVSLLEGLTDLDLPASPPSLFFKLKGRKVGRHGSISVMILHVSPKNTTYIIDVQHLGKAVFATVNSRKESLKVILESPAIFKVIFDVRNDSDALFSHYQVSIHGIIDLQILELATRLRGNDLLADLADCIEEDGLISLTAKVEWQFAKEKVTRQRDNILDDRPLSYELLEYYTQEIALLPCLYDVYESRLRQSTKEILRAQIEKETQGRVNRSQRDKIDSHTIGLGWGPCDRCDDEAHNEWDCNHGKRCMEDANEHGDIFKCDEEIVVDGECV